MCNFQKSRVSGTNRYKQPDIVCATETWLAGSPPWSDQSPRWRCIYRRQEWIEILTPIINRNKLRKYATSMTYLHCHSKHHSRYQYIGCHSNTLLSSLPVHQIMADSTLDAQRSSVIPSGWQCEVSQLHVNTWWNAYYANALFRNHWVIDERKWSEAGYGEIMCRGSEHSKAITRLVAVNITVAIS